MKKETFNLVIRFLVGLALSLLICAGMILLGRVGSNKPLIQQASGLKGSEVVLTVDGENVEAWEYLYMTSYTAQSLSYYGITDLNTALGEGYTAADYVAQQAESQVTQQAAIRADPVAGLGIARRIAHLTYRSALELEERFGTTVQDDGRFAVASYLEHHADKLVARFDPGSYVVLTEAMNTWDVGRGRGGVEAALARVTARAVVAGVDSDRLYPLELQQRVADALGVPLHVVSSPYGHDGFLIEADAVGALVRGLLGT